MLRDGAATAIRTAIADDEPLARRRLRDLLAHERDFEVIAEYGNGEEAAAGLAAIRPELIFLDVQMPRMNGLELAEKIRDDFEYEPQIVFVTAYSDYALNAFDSGAVDYLMKPLDRARFSSTLNRIRSKHGIPRAPQPYEYLDRIAIRSGGQLVIVRLRDADYATGAGNYVRLHFPARAHLYRITMSEFAGRLPPDQWVRIHRSTVVNVERIASLAPAFHGDFSVLLRSGVQLRMSARYRPDLERIVEGL